MHPVEKYMKQKGNDANRLLASVFNGHYWYHDCGEPDGFRVCQIDWQDLKWLEENPLDFFQYHWPIPMNSGTLEAFGYTQKEDHGTYGIFYHEWSDNVIEFTVDSNGVWWFDECGSGQPIKWVHQLQMLLHGVTGEPYFCDKSKLELDVWSPDLSGIPSDDLAF